MSHRDPKLDPLPGDALRWEAIAPYKQAIEREVLEVLSKGRSVLVKFRTTFLGDGCVVDFEFNLSTWRKKAVPAKVIRRAEDRS